MSFLLSSFFLFALCDALTHARARTLSPSPSLSQRPGGHTAAPLALPRGLPATAPRSLARSLPPLPFSHY